MRALFAGVVVLAMGSGACALIAGLGDYEGHAAGSDGSAPVVTVDDGGGSMTTDDGTPLNSDDEPTTADADVPDVSSDGFFIVTGDTDAALSPDVNTKCDTTTCAGCCQDGMCVGGQSVATCGKGGGTCKDCTGMGGACSSGACTMKVADAGPAMTCNPSKCPLCIPVYQSSCCKTSDQTCGCKTNFGGNGQCN
jgi:hypothetical protein